MVKMAKIEAILGAARTRTMRRTKDNLEKGRQPPEKMSIFCKARILFCFSALGLSDFEYILSQAD